MKEIATLTVKLLLICVIVTGLLAAVNTVTAPIIAENSQKNFEVSMREVLPSATSFEKLHAEVFSPVESGVTLDSLYLADNGGYVANTVCSEGYGGDVSVMVGITPELTVAQVRIMSMSETPGLGAKANNTDFTDQYRNLSSGIEVVKNTAPNENQISAISGATVTSKAVTKAVNTALCAAKSAKGGEL